MFLTAGSFSEELCKLKGFLREYASSKTQVIRLKRVCPTKRMLVLWDSFFATRLLLKRLRSIQPLPRPGVSSDLQGLLGYSGKIRLRLFGLDMYNQILYFSMREDNVVSE